MQLGKEEKEGGRCSRQKTCGTKKIPEHVGLEARKSRPGAFKIEPRRVQNRGPGPPKSSPGPSKTPFLKISDLKKEKKARPLVFGDQNCDFGSILEPRDPPKSNPEREKSGGEKNVVFGIDFSGARTSFWEGF